MSRSVTWLLGLLSLAVLCVACVALYAQRIEDEIGAAARAALDADGLNGDVQVEVSGRDVTLRAEDTESAAEAVALVAAVPGVRSVRGETLAPLPDLALGGPVALLPLASGGLALRGTVPDDATRQRLLAAARAAFPSETVRDGLDIDSTVSAEWASDVTAALPLLRSVRDPGLAVDAEGALVLSGELDGEGVQQALLSRVTRVVFPRQVRGAFAPDGAAAASASASGGPADSGVASGTEPGPDTGAAAGEAATPEAEGTQPASLRRVAVENALPGDSEATGLAAALRQRLGDAPVRFQPGSDRLAEGSAEVLARAVAALQAHPEIAVELQAHTDGEGPTRINQRLSEARARAAKRALVEAGADPDQILAAGYGESTPIADNDTEAGRELNRRVVFKLLRRR